MAKYSTVLANEFNTIRNTVVAVLNTGTGTRSYGSPVVSAEVAVGQKITPSEFDVLKTDINVCYNHIAGTDATLDAVVKGGKITWAEIVTYQVAATYIDTNRDTNGGAKTSPSVVSTLPAGWGNDSGNRVATVTGAFTWGSAEEMRYYFNQSSSLSITGSGAATGGSSKSNAFGGLANSISVPINAGTYRAGNGNSQHVDTATAPYSTGTPSNIDVNITKGTASYNFTIVCTDKGGDDGDSDGIIVNSNIDIPLNFTLATNNVSNTTGITKYTPTITVSAWSYAA